jgi:secreted trypsin-like serine protease
VGPNNNHRPPTTNNRADDPLASKLKTLLEMGKVRATAGTTNAYSPKNANFTIKQIFYHSKFDPKSPIGFDVSLVEVNEQAKVKTKYAGELPFINTVCLPIEGKDFSKGQAVKIAGWGDTESKDPKSKPENLLTTDMRLTDAERCAEIFGKRLKKVKNQYHNYKDFICADYQGKRDACQGKYEAKADCTDRCEIHLTSAPNKRRPSSYLSHLHQPKHTLYPIRLTNTGDSGGSLLEFADGKAVAVGIVSYGLGCATKGTPGVYEKTSSLMPWIKDITQNREKAKVQFTLLKPLQKKDDS